ncbi:MAG: malto-oligosyltrehalose synthase, partial [Verrucomicrobia bacterium]
VYRTYLAPGQPVSDEDRQVIERAIAAAKRRNPAIEESIFNFLRDILLFRFPENLDAQAREEHMQFVLRFQQFTGPIMAKGLEDTAFYIYNRLAALNEVGGEPQQFGLSVDAFHERNLDRHRNWPATLLATSTHDTKRSEDVRARMVAISEIPELWRRSLQRWRTVNRRWKKDVNDSEAPDANEEYLLYQTLLGTWPVAANGAPAENVGPEYIERIQAYMTKALNEAKLNTSWIQPNEEWLAATRDFVAKILEPSTKNKFLPTFLPVAQEIARLGAVNALAQALLKLTSPGVPDIYQGNEVWNYSLVDPDNRRPVDYKVRAEMLSCLSSKRPEDLLQNWPDGRIKMFLTQRALHFRNEHAELFRNGDYLPLRATGTLADCCISFARRLDRHWAVVIVPRLSSRIGFPPVGDVWKDTAIELPGNLALERGREIFTGRELLIQNRQIRVADALSILPFAMVTS